MTFQLHNRILNTLGFSIGIVFVWFGGLKFFGGLSPAETIAQDTISVLSLGLLGPSVSNLLLAFGECLIGALLIAGYRRKEVSMVAMLHLICTFSPMLFFPERIFGDSLLAFTLLGQYIFKNIVLIASLLTLHTASKLPQSGAACGEARARLMAAAA